MEDWERWADTVRITPLDVNTPYAGNGRGAHIETSTHDEVWLEPNQKPMDVFLHRTLIASLVLLSWAALVLLVLVMLGVIPGPPYEGDLGL